MAKTPGLVRKRLLNVVIKSPRPTQGWVDGFQTISGGDDGHAAAGFQTVQEHQQLREDLHVVLVTEELPARRQTVQFIDEHDTGGRLPGLFEYCGTVLGAEFTAGILVGSTRIGWVATAKTS
jgi:hypothetical protein